MNPFDYLTVLVSIVMGLAIANVLAGIATVMHARDRINAYWPSIAWAVWLFVVEVQHWWAEWGVHATQRWTFGVFLLEILVPVDLFLLSSLVLPPRDEGDRLDLYAWYFRNRGWFFALMFFLPLLALSEELARTGRIWSPVNLAFLIAFAIVAAIGYFSTSRRLHEWLTAQTLVLTLIYVVALFLRLS